MVTNHLQFSPSANLLEMQTGEATDLYVGTFAMFYLASGELSVCFVLAGALSLEAD